MTGRGRYRSSESQKRNREKELRSESYRTVGFRKNGDVRMGEILRNTEAPKAAATARANIHHSSAISSHTWAHVQVGSFPIRSSIHNKFSLKTLRSE